MTEVVTVTPGLPELPERLAWETLKERPHEAQRLFHGRGYAHGEHLQPITVDWLPPVVLLTLFKAQSEDELHTLGEYLLRVIPGCESVQVQHRYEAQGPVTLLAGQPMDALLVEENGLRFAMQLGRVRNTGLFLDMRNGRRWVREQAKDKRVLNLFAYTCGFSVAAIAGGAQSVVNVDMSSPALSAGRENHRLNGHDLERVRFERLNIFKSFGRIKRRGPFDLLVCDPPTFQKGSVDIQRDYPKILRRLDEFMAPGGDVLLCLNAPALGAGFLREAVSAHAPGYDFVQRIDPPEVFRDVRGGGLKVLHFRHCGQAPVIGDRFSR